MINFFQKKRKEPENLKEVLKCFEKLEGKIGKLSEDIGILKKESLCSIQKVGIVRFNPFSEVGSDQSFSVALLNKDNDGVVITSLYTREDNRVYGKPVKAGESSYSLSKEEKTAIEKAKQDYGSKNNGQSNSFAQTTDSGDLGTH